MFNALAHILSSDSELFLYVVVFSISYAHQVNFETGLVARCMCFVSFPTNKYEVNICGADNRGYYLLGQK